MKQWWHTNQLVINVLRSSRKVCVNCLFLIIIQHLVCGTNLHINWNPYSHPRVSNTSHHINGSLYVSISVIFVMLRPSRALLPWHSWAVSETNKFVISYFLNICFLIAGHLDLWRWVWYTLMKYQQETTSLHTATFRKNKDLKLIATSRRFVFFKFGVSNLLLFLWCLHLLI
jgi:hypothetical protein